MEPCAAPKAIFSRSLQENTVVLPDVPVITNMCLYLLLRDQSFNTTTRNLGHPQCKIQKIST